MEIKWLGHACFQIKSRDVTILTDPYSSEGWGYQPITSPADVVTISHDHPHHACTDTIPGHPRLVRGPGEYETRGAMIMGTRTRRRTDVPGAANRNTIYTIQVEDVTICHLGDLGQPLSPDQLERVQDAHVLLVPVGGRGTLTAAEAAAVVAQVEPRYVIPMHYATPMTQGFVTLDDVERFCREMGTSDAPPRTRLSVTSSSLPGEPTVVVLEPTR